MNVNYQAILENPEIFEINREPAHSDHKFYVNGQHTRQSLNGTWKFAYAKRPNDRIKEFYQQDYDCSAFAEIEVPGHIQLQGYDRCQYINTMYPWDGKEFLRPPHISEKYNPVGSYVTYFKPEQRLEGGRMYLSFQGVEIAFFVWLNGTFLGYGEDSFTPSEFDITDLITEGSNKLAVEVYKRSNASWIEDQDFWRFSGIFRDVYIYAVPKTHVRDLTVKADLINDYQDGKLQLAAEMTGQIEGCIKACLTDKENNIIYCSDYVASSEQITITTDIVQVHAWSAEIPYLYTLYLEVYDAAGVMLEAVSQKVGFRNFAMLNDIMCLNGKRIVFKGVNRHEFDIRKGRTISEEDMLWDIRFMKRNNINAVRTSHYPNQSRWYELCDEYGVYLIDEMNLESHGSWQKMAVCEPSWNVPGSLPEWKECVLDRAKSMLERDKNHPSVLIWSCGNESYAGDVLQAVSDYFHEKDNTRLVHYEGVFWNREYDHISDMESRMYAKPADIKEYLESGSKKPYIDCEYMHAMGNSCGGMKHYTDLAKSYEKYQGGFIWDYIDQAVYRRNEKGEEIPAYGGDFDDRATDYGFCTNGIVYADRTESPKVQEVKALYSNIRIHIKNSMVEIQNENLFQSTDIYRFRFSMECEGECMMQREERVPVPAGCSLTVPFGFEVPDKKREYVCTVSAVLAEDTIWAETGHEVAFGQEVCKGSAVKNANTADTFEIIHGDVNIGVKGERFFAMFSKNEGGIISLVYDEVEYITRMPKLSYWRATTDNDRGMKSEYHLAQWLAASMGQRHCSEKFELEEGDSFARLTFVFETACVPSFEHKVVYTMNADGVLQVMISYPGVKELPNMPLFGIDFKLKKELNQFRYYGNGPRENYADRKEGAKLGVYESTARENLSGYLNPQECGNRTDVRWLEVTDGKQEGLRFRMEEELFECSVLPYSAYELENATHIEELPGINYSWVRILAKQMGIGGDDSWGAPVHEPYLIPSEEPLTLNFSINHFLY